MAELRVYSTDPNHPLARCQSESTWEERCVKYAQHVRLPAERDHEDEQGYTWGNALRVDTAPHDALNEAQAKPLTEARVADMFGVPARFLSPEAQTEALRELLSYCRSEAARLRPLEIKIIGGSAIFTDVADRLAKILDGES
jgi:hypothetical protein